MSERLPPREDHGEPDVTHAARAARLLDLHKRLEEHLRGLDAVRRDQSGRGRERLEYWEMVRLAGPASRAIGMHRSTLETAKDIRNVLSHTDCERGSQCEVVAPCEHFLARLEQAVEDITSPPRVRTGQPPRVFEPSDPLALALGHMREGDYSQVVVRDAPGLRLLTVEGVAKWLEPSRELGLADLESATVCDAVAHDLVDAWEVVP
jgi:hypothetical protein